MKKIMDMLCLIIWVSQFVFGILAACGKVTITPASFICATLVCILYYIAEIIRDFYKG